MALDLMMGNYRENHQKQPTPPPHTFTTPTPSIIPSSCPSSSSMEAAEKLIAHETAAGLQSVENFINFLSTTTTTNGGEPERQKLDPKKQNGGSGDDDSSNKFDLNCQAMADDAVTKFRRVISLLGRTRTGHARFRRGPSSNTSSATEQYYQQNASKSNTSSATPSPSPSPPSSFRFFPPPQDDERTTTATDQSRRNNNHSHVLESSAAAPAILCPKPIKQVPMPMPISMSNQHYHHNQFDFAAGIGMDSSSSAAALINFSSCSSAGNSLVTRSTLTGDPDPAAVTGKLLHHHHQVKVKDGGGGGAAGFGSGSGSMSASENGTASFQITNYSSCSAGAPGKRPPLSSASFKIRKCNSGLSGATTGSGATRSCGGTSSGGGRCHCSRKKKLRLKRSVRVPAISSRMADIPPDDYSWRKYGQKPIKGSPHPRGYYKCSTVRGCPARKHVERALDDPAMLIVTYEGDHNHSISNVEATTANLILESS